MPDQTAAPLTPEIVSAILRDPDSPHYPTQITVFCDHCGTEHTGDYMVDEGMSSEERLAVARQHLVANEGWEHNEDGDDFCPTHASSPVAEQPAAATRANTPDVVTVNDEGRTVTTITQKRACNGCGQYLGDVTDAEMNRAIAGWPQDDVRGECAHCRPLVELEAAGCTTWEVTPRSISRVDHDVDQLGVYAKGYWEWDKTKGKTVVVGLRVGTGETRVVARFGDWLVRHPDGTFTVHAAPAADETGE